MLYKHCKYWCTTVILEIFVMCVFRRESVQIWVFLYKFTEFPTHLFFNFINFTSLRVILVPVRQKRNVLKQIELIIQYYRFNFNTVLYSSTIQRSSNVFCVLTECTVVFVNMRCSSTNNLLSERSWWVSCDEALKIDNVFSLA